MTCGDPCDTVVPHAGDVDRNDNLVLTDKALWKVVPHAGDVDRNVYQAEKDRKLTKSSPTRGTWIEMSKARKDIYNRLGRPPRGGRG